uniref:Uncharacterized protein n=1 Tax=Ditylenchus dipsaci TaxID=166011 RepID=A0A915DG48_9BILA
MLDTVFPSCEIHKKNYAKRTTGSKRYLILSSSRLASIFTEKILYMWLVGITIYSIVMTWYTPTMLFSGVAGGFLADPHVGYLPQDEYFMVLEQASSGYGKILDIRFWIFSIN